MKNEDTGYPYDETLKEGDYVTVPHLNRSVYEIKQIINRYWPNGSYTPTEQDSEGLYNPIYSLGKIYDNKYNPVNKSKDVLYDAYYCRRWNIDETIQEFEEVLSRIRIIKETQK